MKSMLFVMNFEVIENIFSERSESKVSSLGKMLYVNCLVGYFKGKDANEKNAMGFDLFRSEIKNYKTWEKQFIELHHAKLISITEERIIFHNHWGMFIDRSVFNKADVPESKKQFAQDYIKEIKDNNNLMDLIKMKHKWNLNKVEEAINLFLTEQNALMTKYSSEHDVFRHLIHWIAANAPKMNVGTESVKSNGKIIGM